MAGFTAFKEELKKPKNGVVPTKFKVQESGNASWFLRPEVNLSRLAEEFGERYEISGVDERTGVDPSTTNRLAADQPDASRDRGLAVPTKESRRDDMGFLRGDISARASVSRQLSLDRIEV